MDYEQSLALYKQGRDKWNEWANAMLAEKKRLIESGEWEAKKESWEGEAWAEFGGHVFRNLADFGYFIFPFAVSFGGTHFPDIVLFSGAIFSGTVWFERTVFSGEVEISHTKFFERAWFNEATFSGDAKFISAIFYSNTWFNGTSFHETADFQAAIFYSNTLFSGVIFNGHTNFSDAKFIADPNNPNAIAYTADFKAVNCETYFNLDGARFEQVPNFTQAHFLEAPSLDRIVIGPKARENPTPPATPPPSPHGEPVEPREGGERQAAILRQAQDEVKQQAQDEVKRRSQNMARVEAEKIPARWRHLRRLATQGQDHENEGDFFAEELKSRRGVFDFPRGENWQRWWAGWLYQLFSDFGRSIWRPFWIWLSITLAYAVTLLTTHDFIAETRKPFELGLNGCFLGDSTPWSTALKVAFDNALFLPQLGVSNAQAQENLCLFGYDIGLKMPNLPPVPQVPDWIAGLGFFHALFSLIMVFLILLAIRNQFRIR